jgi:hypothetical protein
LSAKGLEGYAQHPPCYPQNYQQGAGITPTGKLSITYQQFCGKQKRLKREMFSASFAGYQHPEEEQGPESG